MTWDACTYTSASVRLKDARRPCPINMKSKHHMYLIESYSTHFRRIHITKDMQEIRFETAITTQRIATRQLHTKKSYAFPYAVQVQKEGREKNTYLDEQHIILNLEQRKIAKHYLGLIKTNNRKPLIRISQIRITSSNTRGS